MTKKDIVDKIAGVEGITKKNAEEIVDAVLATISDAMTRGEDVRIKGFGSFSVTKRKKRLARNPRTGETVEIQPKNVPVFRPAEDLKKRVDGTSKIAEAD